MEGGKGGGREGEKNEGQYSYIINCCLNILL